MIFAFGSVLRLTKSEHAQHVIELIDHRHHQHRAPSIAVALVERDALLEDRVALAVSYASATTTGCLVRAACPMMLVSSTG